jgi:hypothetical protein
MEWPARCGKCKQPIDDWAAAGYDGGRWVHKDCWTQANTRAGREVANLASPLERLRELEAPMFLFILLFHFGTGAAVTGWILFAQHYDESIGSVVFPLGMIASLIGVVGTWFNIVSRRRIELIRRTLDLEGGWKPGR